MEATHSYEILVSSSKIAWYNNQKDQNIKFGASFCIYLWVFLIVVVMNCENIYEIIPAILTGKLNRDHGECFFL